MANIKRYFMYQQIKCKLNNPLSGKILGVSGIKNFQPMIDMKKSLLTLTSYPKVDMQNLPFKENFFDVVISDQVIEHLPSPQKAIDESWRVLKKGGLVIHTSCLINPLHHPKPDYWRFTPNALRLLCRKFSKIRSASGWGNRLVIFFSFLFPQILPKNVNLKRWAWLRFFLKFNESKYPIVTWVIAEK